MGIKLKISSLGLSAMLIATPLAAKAYQPNYTSANSAGTAATDLQKNADPVLEFHRDLPGSEIIWYNGAGGLAVYWDGGLYLHQISQKPTDINVGKLTSDQFEKSGILCGDENVGENYARDCVSQDDVAYYYEQPVLRSTVLGEIASSEAPSTFISYWKLDNEKTGGSHYVENHLKYQLVISKGTYGSGIGPLSRKYISVYHSEINNLDAVFYTTNSDEYVCAWFGYDSLCYDVIIFERDFDVLRGIIDSFVVPNAPKPPLPETPSTVPEIILSTEVLTNPATTPSTEPATGASTAPPTGQTTAPSCATTEPTTEPVTEPPTEPVTESATSAETTQEASTDPPSALPPNTSGASLIDNEMSTNALIKTRPYWKP